MLASVVFKMLFLEKQREKSFSHQVLPQRPHAEAGPRQIQDAGSIWWQRPKYLSHHLLFLRVYIARELELEA